MTRVPRCQARARLPEAAVDLIRCRGFAATGVDDLRAAVGVTKGDAFHHFASRNDPGRAAVEHGTETTAALFAAHPRNGLPDPLDRLSSGLDPRRAILDRPVADVSCVAGTAVQATFPTRPGVRAAAADSIRSGVEHVRPHLAAALAARPLPGVTVEDPDAFVQVAEQGGIVLAKAAGDPAPARAAPDHVGRNLRRLRAARPS